MRHRKLLRERRLYCLQPLRDRGVVSGNWSCICAAPAPRSAISICASTFATRSPSVWRRSATAFIRPFMASRIGVSSPPKAIIAINSAVIALPLRSACVELAPWSMRHAPRHTRSGGLLVGRLAEREAAMANRSSRGIARPTRSAGAESTPWTAAGCTSCLPALVDQGLTAAGHARVRGGGGRRTRSSRRVGPGTAARPGPRRTAAMLAEAAAVGTAGGARGGSGH